MNNLDVRPIAIALNVVAYSLLAGIAGLVMFGSSLLVNRGAPSAHPAHVERQAATLSPMALQDRAAFR